MHEKSHHDRISRAGELVDLMFRHTPIVAVYLDASFNFIWVNEAYAVACRHEPAFFVWKNHFELYPHAENQVIFQRVVDTGEPYAIKAKPFVFPDQPDRGVTYWDWNLVPVKGRDGRVEGLIFTLLDVTDQIRFQEALKESEQQVRTILETMALVAVMLDSEGRIILCNDYLLKLTGWSRDEVMGRNWFDTFLPADIRERVRGVAFDERLRPRAVPAHYENEIVTRTGERRLIEWNNTMLRGSDGMVGIASIGQDVTDRKRAEADLKGTVEELARSNRDLEQFASVASHDLKEPLRMITGFMSLLRERVAPRLEEQERDFMRLAEEGGARLQMLVDDLLSYAKAGRPECLEPVDVDQVIQEALENLKAAVDQAEARIHVGPMPRLPFASRLELAQVFQNLIANALKFHRKGVPPEARITAEREGEFWRFKVADNGIGIDPVYRERIFRIFERLHGPDEYAGTGIGLAICKKIVEKSGGQIWVEPNPEGGSIFCFTFPAA